MSLTRSTWPSAKTDEGGWFELASLDEGLYLASADVERGDRKWRLRREVEPGPDSVTWSLEEGRLRLSVRVLDPEGARAASASVHLVVGGRAHYAYASEGIAQFHDFADAPFVRPAGIVAQLFYDEGPALWAATAVSDVDLAKGEAVVRCVPGGVIEGHVAPGTHGHVPEGTVYAHAAGGGLRGLFSERKAQIGSDGAFRFEAMAPGPWKLYAWGPQFVTLTDDVVANAGDADVVLRPFATTRVKVRVVDSEGRPVADATVGSDLQFDEQKVAVTDAAGIAVLDVRPGVARSLWARTKETVPRSAGRTSWMPEETTLTLVPKVIADATLVGVVKDTKGSPISFIAIWGRQDARVIKARADEAGRFRLENLIRGPVTLEVRLAEGWDQPESMAPAMTVAAVAPAEDVALAVDLGATLRVRFSNWPYDVDREGAVLISESDGALVRPVSWPWAGIQFARLDPRTTYTLFAHATATDLFTMTSGLRAGEEVVVRLERGVGIRGRVLGLGGDEEAKVVATLFGVEMEADFSSDGHFEIRGLPADVTVDVLASSVGPGGARREARVQTRAGNSGIELTPTPLVGR